MEERLLTSDEPFELPITGELDLHAFRPSEARDLVVDYLGACRERGILRIRIVHGKGTGTLRRIVHATLARIPWVVSFRLASSDEGHWGATVAVLAPLP